MGIAYNILEVHLEPNRKRQTCTFLHYVHAFEDRCFVTVALTSPKELVFIISLRLPKTEE